MLTRFALPLVSLLALSAVACAYRAQTVSAAAPAAAPARQTERWPLRRHVRTQAYYGLNDVNADVPAAVMAEHVDIAEDDGFEAKHADAFKRAGGAMAIAYTDPTYVPHCVPPFTPPAGRCEGPIGNLISDERGFVHDARGARVHRFYGARYQYQEVLNVASDAAQRAYARTTAAILAKSPRLDGFEADDSGSPFSFEGQGAGSNLYYGFAGTGADLAGDDGYIAGEIAMLAAPGKPILINGGDPATYAPAYGGRFLDLPYVWGQQFEGCFNHDGGYLFTDDENRFVREENGLLAVIAHRKSAVCYPTGDTSPPHRLYAYAAFLLGYDPRYSVYESDVPQADGVALYPETELVPLQPRTVPTDIVQLRAGGLYVREFVDCAIGGVPVGACAAVVNPAARAVPIPPLALAYGRHVVLDAQSLYHGGRARVAAGAPAALAPASAAVLVR